MVSLGLSFVFGVKTGLLRQDPLFSRIIKIYNITQNFKLEIKKILTKKKIQVVSNNQGNINTDNNLELKNNLEIYNGSVPSQFIISSSLSVWDDDEVKHKLVFISDKEIIHEISLEEIETVSKNDNIFKWPHGLIIDNEYFIYYNLMEETALQRKIFVEKLFGL